MNTDKIPVKSFNAVQDYIRSIAVPLGYEPRQLSAMALITKMTLGDIGMSGLTYETEGIIKGKVYTVDRISNFGFYTVPWIINEEGCSIIPDINEFELL